MAGKGQAPQHLLERRSSLLAQKITGRMSDLTETLRAANGRIPFHTKLSRNSALDWWADHRYDDLGAKALKGLGPTGVMSLDTALAQYAQQKQSTGLPIETTPGATGALDQNAAPPPTVENGGGPSG